MTYIHPNCKEIDDFIQKNIVDRSTVETVWDGFAKWLDKNVKYSRLNAPFFPLQRSDLDVISMQAGTCGDYSNLLVSVLITLGYDTSYAYIHRDCYGDKQDHICVAVRDLEQWILLDPTQPYRKWHGFHCLHQEYELLSPNAFEERMKREECHWIRIANQYGNERYAGLLYAPWIHEEIIRESESMLESVFFLLLLDEQKSTTLYAYFRKFSKEHGTIPLMSIISNGIMKFCFSCRKADSIWDNEQWSEAFLEKDVPDRYKTKELFELKMCIAKVLAEINKMLSSF